MCLLERRHDPLHRLLDFPVGQRAIGGAERQAEGDAHLAVRDSLALVPIELVHADECLRRGCLDRVES